MRKAQKPKPLGKVTKTARNFELLQFQDSYGVAGTISMQASSIILGNTDKEWSERFEKPGTSAVWFGLEDLNPRIMASKAAAHGVKTKETTGWVPFPISDDVLFNTQFHLDRAQVEGLVAHLQAWLKTGSFKL